MGSQEVKDIQYEGWGHRAKVVVKCQKEGSRGKKKWSQSKDGVTDEGCKKGIPGGEL